MAIDGTNLADTLFGTLGDDIINGLGGNDFIYASQGADAIDGGAGTDQLIVNAFDFTLFAAATGPRSYTLTSSGISDSSGTLNTSFTSIERVRLSTADNGDFDDTIDASGFASAVAGTVFSLVTGNGNDTIIGSASADFLDARLGSNIVDAGGGFDNVIARSDNRLGLVQYVTSSGSTVITTENGVVTNQVTNAEIVRVGGSYLGNSIVDGLTTRVDASGYTPVAGVQLLFDDHNGDDIFIGSSGADIFGNTYTFTVGNDTYTGNGGADVYDYTVAVNALNNDVITDFDNDDIIDFQFNDGIIAGQLLANQFIGAAAFSGVAGEYRYATGGGQTFVQLDTDGDALADRTLTLANGQFALAETAPGSNILHMIGTSGTSGADTLTGTPGDDAIYAQEGNDIINGSQGADFIDGGPGGGDRLFMNTGDGSLFTLATGARTYMIGANSITDNSGTLDTSFTGVERVAFSTVGNGDFDDVIDASGFVSAHGVALDIRLGNGDNQVTGSGSNDRLFTGFGSTIVDGGAGYDQGFANVDAASDVTVTIHNVDGVLVTDANGAINQFTNFEEVWVQGVGAATVTLDASGYTDIDGLVLVLVGHDGSDIMLGSSGNDLFANITGHTLGNDVYTGNGGADLYDYTFAVDSMDGDTITDFDLDDVIDFRFNNLEPGGSPLLCNIFIGAAAFSGVAGEYRYATGGGQTFVQVDTDGDTIADETLTIGNGQFALGETFAGSNILQIIGASGTSGVDTLTGTLGDDAIYAQQGNDIINGSQGTDFIDGGPGGGDRLFMNTGNASLFTAATGARTYIIGANSIADSSGTLDTSFANVERVAFSTIGNGDFDDIIDASGYSSAHPFGLDIRVGDGDNLITGSGSDDRIFTGFGSNIVDGGAGHDYGFAAIDTSSAATVFITTVGDSLVTTVNGVSNSFTNVEEMQVFGVGTSALTLDATGWTPIAGQALYLVGHNGTDIMIGSTGNDFFANATGQVLGNDVYTGNGGADIYDYTFAADSMNGDTITDFDIDDVIDFRFNNLEPGGSPVLCNTFIGAAAFSGIAGEYRYQIDGTQTVIQLDSDGDAIADQVVTISNGAFMLAETEAGSNILTLAATIDPLTGLVADGYLEGATLFVDIDGDRILDDGEAWTITGPGGAFSLNVNQGGALVAIGGTNADTGLANMMTLAAPSDSGIVNPLTTLVQAVIDRSEGSLSAADAMGQVKAALGLDPALDLFNLDLIAAAATDPAALEAQKAAAMIANLVTTAEAAAEADAGTEALLVAAMADLVADGGGTIDLTDTETLVPLLAEALPGSDVDAMADEIAFEGEAIAAATSIDGIAEAQIDAHLFDHVAGSDGHDVLTGGAGRDRIVGGDGVDFLRGGGGDDLFVAEVTPTQVKTKAGTLSFDVIFDFSAGDLIDLSGLDANANVEGHQSFNWKGTNANKGAGDLSFKTYTSIQGAEKALGFDIDGVDGTSPYSGSVTIVFGNVDGGAPDFALALIGVNGVTTSDFLFG